MNRHYISRFVLMIVLLLGLCAKGWADGEIPNSLNESFTNFPTGNFAGTTIYNGWTYGSAEYLTSIQCFRINGGTLQSPKVSVNGNAIITFEYANASQNNKDLKYTLTIKDNGNIIYTKTSEIITIDHTSNEYPVESVTFCCVSTDVTIEISKTGSNGLLLKYVRIEPTSPVNMTLEDSKSNSELLSTNIGLSSNVTIGRTFPANTWCTLCLPFDVTVASVKEACGQTVTPRLRVFSSVEGNTMKFTPPENDAVSAGTPFLLKFTTAVTSNPVFNGVTISKTEDAVTPAATVTSGGCSFIGTYSPVSINPTDCFLKADGKLYQLGPETEGNRTLPGLRAYFTLPTTTSGARPVVSIAGDDATTVGAAASVAPSVEAIYTLGGLTVASPKSPGIYIVRRTDGSTQKVTIR